MSRSSVAGESVESWRSGEGDGNELTNERMKELANEGMNVERMKG